MQNGPPFALRRSRKQLEEAKKIAIGADKNPQKMCIFAAILLSREHTK